MLDICAVMEGRMQDGQRWTQMHSDGESGWVQAGFGLSWANGAYGDDDDAGDDNDDGAES